jgi:hypothetical protein
MELLSVLGVLRRRRVLVALGLVPTLLIWALLSGRLAAGPAPLAVGQTGIAQLRVMVDHPKTTIPRVGAGSVLPTQAALLADLAASDAQRLAIARRASIPAAALGMQRMQLARLFALGQLPERAADASAGVAAPYVVSVSAAAPLPIVTFDVRAPSAREAARLATAARASLEAAVAARAPDADRGLVIKPLGGVRSASVPVTSLPPVVAVAAAVVLFALWCCGVVVLHGLLRAWRRIGARPVAAAAAGDATAG